MARFVAPNIFPLKGGGYGCLFSLTGIDEQGIADLELDSRMRSIERSCTYRPKSQSSLQRKSGISSYFAIVASLDKTFPRYNVNTFLNSATTRTFS